MNALSLKDRIQNVFLENGTWRGAEIYLLIVVFVFGLAACFLLPISGGYDEETHLMRVWEMSDLTLIPNDKLGGKLPFPAVYWELSYRRQVIVRPVEAGFWNKYKQLSIDSMDYIYGEIETRSVYSPPLLLPQAIVMRMLGRHWHFPALTVYYTLRITGLLCYMLLAWLAVRWIPFGKWVLAILASTPVAILQASTISADAISNGLALLFIGGSIAVATQKELRWRELGALAFLFFMLFWGKLNIVPLAILPFLMIRPSQFKIKYGFVLLLLMAAGLFALEVAGWNLLVLRRTIGDAAWTGDARAAVLPRHARALSEAAARLHDAATADSPELIASSLRAALDALGEVTGRISPDDVIGRIFSTFCIGK